MILEQIINDSIVLKSMSKENANKIFLSFDYKIELLKAFYQNSYNFNKKLILDIIYLLYQLKSNKIYEALILAKINNIENNKISKISFDLFQEYLIIENDINFNKIYNNYTKNNKKVWFSSICYLNKNEDNIYYDDISLLPLDNFIEINGRCFNKDTLKQMIIAKKYNNPFTNEFFSEDILNRLKK